MDDKVKIYREALDKIIAELTLKRTELAAQARLTVEHLETSIPSLRLKVNSLNTEITKLEKQISDKKAIRDAEYVTAHEHYKELEASLKKEYETRKHTLDGVEKNNTTVLSELTERERRIRLLEMNAEIREGNIVLKDKSLTNRVSEFESTRNAELKKIEDDKKTISKKMASVDALIADNRIINIDLVSQRNILLSRTKDAEDTITRISEVSGILESVRLEKEANDKRDEIINQANAKLQADVFRNNARSAALDKRNALLDERESNIKLLEAALKEG